MWFAASLLALVPNGWDILKPMFMHGAVAVSPVFNSLASIFFITTLGYIDAGKVWALLKSDSTARMGMTGYAWFVGIAGVVCTVTCWAAPNDFEVPLKELGRYGWLAVGMLALALLAEGYLAYEHSRWPKPTV